MPEKVQSNKKKEPKWDTGSYEYFRSEGYYYEDDDIPDEDKH